MPRNLISQKAIDKAAIKGVVGRRLEGTFGWTLQGFMDAQKLRLPEAKEPQPRPPDGYRNPPVIDGYRPLATAGTERVGYYPYSEAGQLTFNKDGSLTAIFRLNIGGNQNPYDESKETQGTYEFFADGTGHFTLGDPPHLRCFFLMSDKDEALLHVDWANKEIGRSTGTGWMKRMR